MENYIEVFKGEENDIFNEDTIQDFVGICLEKNYNKKNGFGFMAFSNVQLKNKELKNVYIEYYLEKMDLMFEVDISRCIIYDDIPDIVLDRINELNKKL